MQTPVKPFPLLLLLLLQQQRVLHIMSHVLHCTVGVSHRNHGNMSFNYQIVKVFFSGNGMRCKNTSSAHEIRLLERWREPEL